MYFLKTFNDPTFFVDIFSFLYFQNISESHGLILYLKTGRKIEKDLTKCQSNFIDPELGH